MATEIDPAPLIRRRMEKGLAQVDVARALHLSPMTIHRIEAGESQGIRSIKRYADYLGIRMGRILKS
jgi:transcriptional regulator with XRE-family HTH domain